MMLSQHLPRTDNQIETQTPLPMAPLPLIPMGMVMPPIHGQIALESARNICRQSKHLAAVTPTGHVPVLVDVQRVGDHETHRFLITLPNGGHDDVNEENSLYPKRPPCPMHNPLGHRKLFTTITHLMFPSGTPALSCLKEDKVQSGFSSLAPIYVEQQEKCKLQPSLQVVPVSTAVVPERITSHAIPETENHSVDNVLAQRSMHVLADFNQLELRTFAEPIHAIKPPVEVSNNLQSALKLSTPPALSHVIVPPAGTVALSPATALELPPPPKVVLPPTVSEMAQPKIITVLPSANARKNHLNGLKQPLKQAGYESIDAANPCKIEGQGKTKGQVIDKPKYLNGEKRLNGCKGQLNGYHSSHIKDMRTFRTEVLPATTNQNDCQQNSNHPAPKYCCDHECRTQLSSSSVAPNICQRVTPDWIINKMNRHSASEYPPELQMLFSWNYCNLCRTAMRTMRNAVDHYSSHAHDRRVNSWLVKNCGGLRNPHVNEDVLRYLRNTGPTAFYCEICDLKLTSIMHAHQHFYGRRHQMVANKSAKPNGTGYYDRSGRWVRTDAKWLMCELCDVSITSPSQMAMHNAGARHRKRLMEMYNGYCQPLDGSHVFRINSNGSLAPLNPIDGAYICTKKATESRELSFLEARALADLSAAYFCEVCNVTLNHLKSVKQHENGRMHKKKLHQTTVRFGH